MRQNNDTALKHLYFFPATLAVLCLALALAGPVMTGLLRFSRSAIFQGEWWRLLTGHLVHLSWNHVLMNVAGLILIWILFGRYFSTRFWIIVATINALGISAALLIFNPEVSWYVGLSGVLHGLFVIGLLENIRKGYRLEILLLIGFIAKLAWEQSAGPTPGSEAMAGGHVLVDAHLYGAIVGALTIIFHFVFCSKRR